MRCRLTFGAPGFGFVASRTSLVYVEDMAPALLLKGEEGIDWRALKRMMIDEEGG